MWSKPDIEPAERVLTAVTPHPVAHRVQAAQDKAPEPEPVTVDMQITDAEIVARVRAVNNEEALNGPSRLVLQEVPSALLHRFKASIWKPPDAEPWARVQVEQSLLARVLADLVRGKLYEIVGRGKGSCPRPARATA